MSYKFKLLDSLTKVFPESEPVELKNKKFTLIKDQVFNFQLAHTFEYEEGGLWLPDLTYTIISDNALVDASEVSRVELVPVNLAAYLDRVDEDYLFTHARSAPDLLIPKETNIFRPFANQWRSLWFSINIPKDIASGNYTYTIEIKNNNDVIWTDEIEFNIVDISLPESDLIHTEWFHGDTLADYYGVEVFSDRHWHVLDKFIEAAVRNGVNMLLTPIFTPPLDTQVGGERTTIQLVKIESDNTDISAAKFTFDFDLLEKWVEISLNHGIKYFEMAHLFTQWGAQFTPKIIINVDGQDEKVFGWHVSATSAEYKNFVGQFLPALTNKLEELGVLENTYFHISDEPSLDHLENYKAAKEVVAPYLEGLNIIDALSNFDFYQKGLVAKPVATNDHIEPFLENNVEGLWTYYCCAQTNDVSNRFMSMPSARNRVLGIQLYLYNIEGFLQWGFNFYNAQFSRHLINPYVTTDAMNAFPSGDAFLVYPAADGSAYDSIRSKVLVEAIQDLAKFKLLESLSSREEVEELIHEGLEYKIDFKKYPKGEFGHYYLLDLDEKITAKLGKLQ